MKRIVVLGMHRSGATALAQAIARLGAAVGDQRHLSRTAENNPLRRVNDALLDAADGSWDAPPAGDEWLTSRSARALDDRARRTLAAEFGTAPVSVWKDPRLSLTLPFWLEHFDDEPVVVLVHRHPAEVAASLRGHGVRGAGHAYALWERYNAAALTAATGLPTIVLDYGQVMTFPAEAATFVAKALRLWGVDLPNDPADTDIGLSPALRHERAASPDRLDPTVATSAQVDLFTLLDTVAGAHRPLSLPTPPPGMTPVSAEILAMAGVIGRLERERKEARQAERKEARKGARRADRTSKQAPVEGSVDGTGVNGSSAAAPSPLLAGEPGR